jgi:FLVCR family feline leukemia virus subgroup C receptor-related protein
MWNRDYVLLLVTYGINVGVFYAMSTLLNQTILQHFPVIRRRQLEQLQLA